MEIRKAEVEDVAAIVALLADDELGATRERVETPVARVYLDAFAALERQEGAQILVAVENGEVIGCLQLTLLPGLSRQGMTRAQIEGVRVGSTARGRGLGEQLIRRAIDIARAEGCGVVQLTTDKRRADAHRFYERLGFEGTHLGMKLALA